MKVIHIMIDGLRPDAMGNCAKAQAFMKKAAYTLQAKTVFPSVTLPCHMSLFHSVDPQRHGTTTNFHMPQVRPINGLLDVLKAAGKSTGFYNTWEELRDLGKPGSLDTCLLYNQFHYGVEAADRMVTKAALLDIENQLSDYMFVYLAMTDVNGHDYGWMTPEYIHAVDCCWACAEQIIEAASEEYCVFVHADHGGHDRDHGTTEPEDITIPVFAYGVPFRPGQTLGQISIKDIAPTIAALMDVPADPDWEGTPFC